ncbi:MAG TPA: ABC transporter permease subunit [Ktedonobacterales bacterium]|nr:ABC transporter permease subunit [Ktedonobacterales bacterium]
MRMFAPYGATPQRGAGDDRTPTRPGWIDAALIVALIALAYGIVVAASHWTAPLTPSASIDLAPRSLPLYAGLSTLRMALAYILSLAFTLVYAHIAAGNRRAERVMAPLLDILQSIPILSFLPGVVLGLVALFPRSHIGLELAAILLIFTSQAWNMTFSFYHSLLIIPSDLREAASVYRLNFWRRFTRLELPFAMIPLIWNSMMSWAGGWFFLMAAEQFTLGPHSFQLPGLGSYLQTAANDGNVGALLLGLATLIAIIVLLDQLLWRPLIAWADRFKLEQTAGGEAPTSGVLRALRRSALLEWLSGHVFAPSGEWLDRAFSRPLRPASRVETAKRETASVAPIRLRSSEAAAWPDRSAAQVVRAIVGVVALAACVWGAAAALRLVAHLSLGDWGNVTVSAGATLLRTVAALAIGVAWTVPLGVAIGLHPRWARRAQPIVQMVASIPATALFPALLLILIGLPGGLNIAAIGLMLLGTQWYVLFNVIAGAMAIPTDLREAAAIYKLRGWQRWRYMILPAIFPWLVTGMITATGGAWNASIVAEYVAFNSHVYQTVGLGALIASSAARGDFALLLAATLAMAAVVVAMNRLVWRPLYRLAEQRFHLD